MSITRDHNEWLSLVPISGPFLSLPVLAQAFPQGLDAHGRPASVAPAPQGDDHLDIPAFLRRQVN